MDYNTKRSIHFVLSLFVAFSIIIINRVFKVNIIPQKVSSYYQLCKEEQLDKRTMSY